VVVVVVVEKEEVWKVRCSVVCPALSGGCRSVQVQVVTAASWWLP
jgi:hypothetical protein